MANKKNVQGSDKVIAPETKEEPAKETTEEKITPQAKEAPPENKGQQSIYVGPTIRGIVSKNTIYLKGAPVELIEKIAKAAGISEKIIAPLFVPVNELAGINVLSDETKVGRCYNELSKRIGGNYK